RAPCPRSPRLLDEDSARKRRGGEVVVQTGKPAPLRRPPSQPRRRRARARPPCPPARPPQTRARPARGRLDPPHWAALKLPASFYNPPNSALHSSRPWMPSSALQNSRWPTWAISLGTEESIPGWRSLTRCVPAAVPSLTHSSKPDAPLLALKN